MASTDSAKSTEDKQEKKSGSNSRPAIGRVIDYLFGRNSLIGLASLMLLAISGYATWSGMNDFIVGVSTSPASQGREIAPGLSVSNSFLVVAIVVALTFLMWLALRESFAYGRRLRDRFLTFPLYLFLALWSIGFGYGFWWSLIAGEEATRKGLAGLQEDARDAGAIVQARLQAVKIQLDSVVQWSDGQMTREESSGGSCGIASGAGRGPLYNARRSVRDSISTLRDSVTTSWLKPVEADLEKLGSAISSLDGGTVEERQKSFETMARTIRGSARSIAARSNQLGKSTATEMRALADAVSVKPKTEGFSCYDPTLAQRLRAAADQADQPAVLQLREVAFSEGAAGVANAVKNMWANIGSFLTGSAGYLVGMGDETPAAEGEGISGRDLIAFLATLGIDLGLFVLTVLNPPQTPPVRQLPGSLKRQIIDAIKTAIKRAPDANWEWVRQHFIHHKSMSYLVIPNIHSADTGKPGEEKRALAMNQLAGVLDDLGLVKGLSSAQLRRLGHEEKRASFTDLTPYRQHWYKEQNIKNDHQSIQRKRNHGLFSKAERALEIAKWSEKARTDVEVFNLEDREGLTPLLDVLNDPGQDLDPYEGAPAELIKIPDAKAQYVAGLIEGAELQNTDMSVISRIEKGGNIVSDALENIYNTWPAVRSHVGEHQRVNADLVQKASVAVTDKWILDRKRSFPITDISRTDLQTAVVIYSILPYVSDDLKRLAGENNEAEDSQRTSAIIEAADAIDAFLDPYSQMTADDLAEALNNAAQMSA